MMYVEAFIWFGLNFMNIVTDIGYQYYENEGFDFLTNDTSSWVVPLTSEKLFNNFYSIYLSGCDKEDEYKICIKQKGNVVCHPCRGIGKNG